MVFQVLNAPKDAKKMTQTVTLTSWQQIGGRQVEYACDYYYCDGVCVGQSNLYYTGQCR